MTGSDATVHISWGVSAADSPSNKEWVDVISRERLDSALGEIWSYDCKPDPTPANERKKVSGRKFPSRAYVHLSVYPSSMAVLPLFRVSIMSEVQRNYSTNQEERKKRAAFLTFTFSFLRHILFPPLSLPHSCAANLPLNTNLASVIVLHCPPCLSSRNGGIK